MSHTLNEWPRSSLARRLTRYLRRRNQTYRDAELANAILMHRRLAPALVEWLMTELTGQPNKEWRTWPFCGLRARPRKRQAHG